MSAAPADVARLLVFEHGWNTSSYHVLDAGVQHWLADDAKALVGYIRSRGLAIVIGAPICSETRLPDTVRAWESYANRAGMETCYVGAESRLQDYCRRSPEYCQVVFGIQPEWRFLGLADRLESNPTFFRLVSLARQNGVVLSEASLIGDPASAAVEEVKAEQTETIPIGCFAGMRRFVATHRGQPVGSATYVPVPARRGWVVEQLIHQRSAPVGTAEMMLFDSAKALESGSPEFLALAVRPNNRLESASRLTLAGRLRLNRFDVVKPRTDLRISQHPEDLECGVEIDDLRPVAVIAVDRRIRFRHVRAIEQVTKRIALNLE